MSARKISLALWGALVVALLALALWGCDSSKPQPKPKPAPVHVMKCTGDHDHDCPGGEPDHDGYHHQQ